MLTQHHRNGFAGKRRAWHRYGIPCTGWPNAGSNDVSRYVGWLPVQLESHVKVLLACRRAQVTTGLLCLFAWVVFIGSDNLEEGSSNEENGWEQRVWARRFTFSPRDLVASLSCWVFGLAVGFVAVAFCWVGWHPGFLHGICLEPIGLLL